MIRLKYLLTILLGATMLLSSCKKWLDVQPRTRVTLNTLYSTEDGFIDALTGIYIQMKSSSLYGKELIYGTMEQLISSAL